ncbi:quinoprotein dehydrogenase-associated putative ABC transporter substrate-binding protein [Georhizobium sp. MAB10]|uniref:quinoprotein dehydrogenase-associated putative ABC transporter substrate-binding protein n=1 Tax=Georhizobium sp. MAB10 TaxID=3028319 RepID=UPI003855D9E2
MTGRLHPTRFILALSFVIVAMGLGQIGAEAQTPAGTTPGGMGSIGAQQGSFGRSLLGEIVDRTRLRVCADPGNLPYSNDKGEGFENKIAELIADELGVPIDYTWFPQTVGFVRMTLGASRCDVVIGVATTNELMQNTNPYYRAAYMIVHRADLVLPSGDLDDPSFDNLRIGIQPGTPGATTAARYGHLDQSKHYPLIVDTRIDKPARDMVQDVADGDTDAALVWGPLAGYWIQQIDPNLVMEPLQAARGTERVDYRISMGIRHGENDWKDQLNAILMEHKADIDAILQSYGVPLLDNAGKLILPMTLPAAAEPAQEPDDAGGSESQAGTQQRSELRSEGDEDANGQAAAEALTYRMDNYRAPVPDGVAGAQTIDVAAMRALVGSDNVVLIDVMPAPPLPDDRPDDSVWREPERETIPGAHWLANMGYGKLQPGEDAAFHAKLDELAGPDAEKGLVFFCERDCWMSWNAAKRAVEYGFTDVTWFPDGVTGWVEDDGALESVRPWRPDLSAATIH